MLTLVSDLAANYFRLLELDRELAIAQESASTYKKTLDLFNYRFEAGKDSKLPVERAQASYDASTALTHDLTRQIGQTENAISTLLGAYPQGIARGARLEDQTMPDTPVGSTTALLQRRPDILQAEQSMIAANARIGEAVADFFPRIGISTLIGGQGIGIGNAWSGFGVWSAALSTMGPIYSGGGLEGSYHQRQAYWDESIANLQAESPGRVPGDIRCPEGARDLAAQAHRTGQPGGGLKRATDLALLRYDAGRASYFEVLEAQQQYFSGAYDLAQTERDQLLAVVSLYKALGGGWTAEPTQPGASGPTATLINANVSIAESEPKAMLSPAHVEMVPPGSSVQDAILSLSKVEVTPVREIKPDQDAVPSLANAPY